MNPRERAVHDALDQARQEAWARASGDALKIERLERELADRTELLRAWFGCWLRCQDSAPDDLVERTTTVLREGR